MGPRARRFPCQRGMARYCVLIVACFYCCILFLCVYGFNLSLSWNISFLSLDCPPLLRSFFLFAVLVYIQCVILASIYLKYLSVLSYLLIFGPAMLRRVLLRMACFLYFRAESILVVTSGISHEVFVLFRATNHESVA